MDTLFIFVLLAVVVAVVARGIRKANKDAARALEKGELPGACCPNTCCPGTEDV